MAFHPSVYILGTILFLVVVAVGSYFWFKQVNPPKASVDRCYNDLDCPASNEQCNSQGLCIATLPSPTAGMLYTSPYLAYGHYGDSVLRGSYYRTY